jgi:DNA-directed RNA polymerase specialized sigma24 family protein
MPDSASPSTGSEQDPFGTLLAQISYGDRDAFTRLFDETSGPLLDRIHAEVRDPQQAVAVLAATYVEVWWLAGCRPGREDDVATWIDQIARRRLRDGTPRINSRRYGPVLGYAVLELADLLGRPADALTSRRPASTA